VKTWAMAVFCGPAILAILGYLGPEALDRYEQHKARQVNELLEQRFEELQRSSRSLEQRTKELQNDVRRTEEAVELWRYKHHLPPFRSEIHPIPPARPWAGRQPSI
jgi:hypothetical protein